MIIGKDEVSKEKQQNHNIVSQSLLSGKLPNGRKIHPEAL